MKFNDVKFIVISAHNPKNSRGMLAITFKDKKERDEFAKSTLSSGLKIEAHKHAENLAVIRLPIEGAHRKEKISAANQKKALDAVKKAFPKAYDYESKHAIGHETRHSDAPNNLLERTVFRNHQNQQQILPRQPQKQSWIGAQFKKAKQFVSDFFFAPSRHRITSSFVGGSILTAAAWMLGLSNPVSLVVTAAASAATIYTGMTIRNGFNAKAVNNQPRMTRKTDKSTLKAHTEGQKAAKGWTPYLSSQLSANNWTHPTAYGAGFELASTALQQQGKNKLR